MSAAICRHLMIGNSCVNIQSHLVVGLVVYVLLVLSLVSSGGSVAHLLSTTDSSGLDARISSENRLSSRHLSVCLENSFGKIKEE